MLSEDFIEIEAGLREVLGALTTVLSEAERLEVIDFVDVGEFGVALEPLSALLVEERKRVPATAYSQMVALSEKMGIRASVITSDLQKCVT